MNEDLTKNQRMLKGVVIGLGILIIVILMIIVGTIMYRLTADKATSPAANAEMPIAAQPSRESSRSQLALPAGTEIVDVQLAGDRLLLWLRGSDFATRFQIIDLDRGEVIHEIEIEKEAAP